MAGVKKRVQLHTGRDWVLGHVNTTLAGFARRRGHGRGPYPARLYPSHLYHPYLSHPSDPFHHAGDHAQATCPYRHLSALRAKPAAGSD